MPYQRVRCQAGHTFMTHVYSKYQRLECPQCYRPPQTYSPPADYSAPSYEAPAPSYEPPAPSPSFESGGGGDFGGGGASGDY